MEVMQFEIPQSWINPGSDVDAENEKKEDAVLCLDKFAAVPWVRFGLVRAGSTATGTITFVNSTDSDIEVKVVVDKIHKTLNTDRHSYSVPKQSSSVVGIVSWTPDAVGGFRQSIQLRMNNHRLMVVAFGVAVEKKKSGGKV